MKAVKEGLCNLALGNSYYLGKMLQDEAQNRGQMRLILIFQTKLTVVRILTYRVR